MSKNSKNSEIKCVVWDLDDTLWEGILLESDELKLKPGIKDILQSLDSRGILHSIASRNNYDMAMEKVKEFKLHKYFLYPEINWNAKYISIEKIQKNLNINLDSIMFVDDQPFERDEVSYVFPEVLCMDASDYKKLIEHPRLNPKFITSDSKKRRLFYEKDIMRKEEEERYQGSRKDFLASLRLQFIISEAMEEDIERAEELSVRTNKFNSIGTVFNREELRKCIDSEDHKLLICKLKNKYGDYGRIGLALIQMTEKFWYIRVFLISCRVISFGAGAVLLSYIMQQAKHNGKKLRAYYRQTGKNRLMYITFKFANFREIAPDHKGNIILENNLSIIQPFPLYSEVMIP
ncbi:HAD-IIIC family phosphatase [Acidobacteriota bacterium]